MKKHLSLFIVAPVLFWFFVSELGYLATDGVVHFLLLAFGLMVSTTWIFFLLMGRLKKYLREADILWISTVGQKLDFPAKLAGLVLWTLLLDFSWAWHYQQSRDEFALRELCTGTGTRYGGAKDVPILNGNACFQLPGNRGVQLEIPVDVFNRLPDLNNKVRLKLSVGPSVFPGAWSYYLSAQPYP